MDRLNQLLRMLETSGEEERSLIDDLSPEERAQKGQLDDWSFKDNVAHYAFWRQRLAENLNAIAAGRPPEWKEWYLEIEDRNRMIFDRYQSQSSEEIFALSATALEDLREAVRGVEHELETVGLNPPPSQEFPLWRRVGGTGYIHPMNHLIWYAHKRGDMVRHRHLSLILAEQCMALDDSPAWQGLTNYNLACYYSLAGETEKAIEFLRSALDMWPSQLDWSRKDPDLDPIRSDPGFQRILTDLEAKA